LFTKIALFFTSVAIYKDISRQCYLDLEFSSNNGQKEDLSVLPVIKRLGETFLYPTHFSCDIKVGEKQ
jgi:hypothetical protein